MKNNAFTTLACPDNIHNLNAKYLLEDVSDFCLFFLFHCMTKELLKELEDASRFASEVEMHPLHPNFIIISDKSK